MIQCFCCKYKCLHNKHNERWISMLKLAKFGGSSLANSEQFKKVANIIKSDNSRKLVVVSAPGARFSEDKKITDMLLLTFQHLKYNFDYSDLLKQIEERFMEIKSSLNLSIDIASEFDIIKEDIKKIPGGDYLVSRGEYRCAKCLAEYLDYDFVDARDLIIFKYNGVVDIEASQKRFDALKFKNGIVFPGFYGAYENGDIHLFSRGGSDISGAIISRLANVNVYENWTDVSGLLMCDPRVVKNPLHIELITQIELRELSYRGANVLHEEALLPLKDTNIPIHILNTNDPSHPGTTIVETLPDNDESFITGIVGKKDYVAINLLKNPSISYERLVIKICEIFERYHLKIEHLPNSVDTISIITQGLGFGKVQYPLLTELKTETQALNLQVIDGISLIAVVGRGMAHRPGTSGKVFGLLGNNNINIKLINQDSSEMTIIIGVENKDYKKTIQLIYTDLLLEH